MKNYSKIASKYGVIGSYMDTRDYIETYQINKESKYVKINYMSGWYKTEELQEDTQEQLETDTESLFATSRKHLFLG